MTQCLELCGHGSFSHTGELDAGSAFSRDRHMYSMVSQDSIMEGKHICQAVPKGLQLGTTRCCDATQQKVSAYIRRFGKGIQTGHNMVPRRNTIGGKSTRKALLNGPPTGHDNKDVMRAEWVGAWMHGPEAMFTAIVRPLCCFPCWLIFYLLQSRSSPDWGLPHALQTQAHQLDICCKCLPSPTMHAIWTAIHRS
jgi:hypothetical protein